MTRDAKKILKIVGVALFLMILVVYTFFQARDLIFGVKIKNVNLSDGATVQENTIKVTGNAKNAVILTLNGREISIDQTGNFEETIALLPGYNVISIRAEDKFGYIDEKNYQLIH